MSRFLPRYASSLCSSWSRRLVLGTIVITVFTARAQAATHTVNAGGDLQAALNAAQPGDTIMLAAGATFVGNFVLPVKTGSDFITIRSTTSDAMLPGASTRITPAASSLLAKLRSPNSAPALATAPGAHHYRIMFLEFLPNTGGLGDIITLGDGSWQQNTLAVVPHNIVLDRVYIHGDAAAGQKRAIGLNSASTTIINSHISDIKAVGQDAQAIAGWNGPGPYAIENNHLEAAGENLLFGGADPRIPNLIPSDITIRRNYFTKPLAWRQQNWQVKNLLELKSAKRVRIEGNTFDGHWASAAGPNGSFIWLKSTNQDGTCTWCETSDVEFVNNVVRNIGSGFNLAPNPDNPAVPMSRITIRNNLFLISRATFGGDGRFILQQGVADVTVDHNTIISDGDVTLYMVEKPSPRMKFTNNILIDNNWGVLGQGTGEGKATINFFMADGEFAGNVLVTSSAFLYPAGNLYPSSLGAVGFVGLANGDYRLSADSIYARAATDGTNPGVNHEALEAAANGSSSGPIASPPSTPPASSFSPSPSSGSSAPTLPASGAGPASSSAAATADPNVPGHVTALVNGSTVTVTWSAPASGVAVDRYVLEAGTAPGAANAAVVTLDGQTRSLVAQSVASGIYYVRVRAARGSVMSNPSGEVRVVVGGLDQCSGNVAAPNGLRATVTGQLVTLTWNASSDGCTPSGYLILAGSRPGLGDLAQAPSAAPSFSAYAPSGTYHVRVVALGPAGASAPSSEVIVTVP